MADQATDHMMTSVVVGAERQEGQANLVKRFLRMGCRHLAHLTPSQARTNAY